MNGNLTKMKGTTILHYAETALLPQITQRSQMNAQMNAQILANQLLTSYSLLLAPYLVAR